MASSPPKKNAAYTFYVALTSQADTDIFKTTPTLAAGDITVSKDGGNFNNIGTLPTQIQATGVLPVVLTADEMNADKVVVLFHDAAGAEWQDLVVHIDTVARQIDDLAFPTVSGRSIDVDANGGVEVGSFQLGAINEDAIAPNTITSSELAASAIDAIANQVWDELLAGHAIAGSAGKTLDDLPTSGAFFPAGAINFTYTVTSSTTGLPIEGVEVWFSTDVAGANIVWKGDTDAFGIARDVNGALPALDAGTYYVWRQRAGYTFVDPDTEVVS